MLSSSKKYKRSRYAAQSFSKAWFKVFSERTIPFLSAIRSAVIRGAAGKPGSDARLTFNLVKYGGYSIAIFRFMNHLESSNMIVRVRYISEDKLTFRMHYCYGPPIKVENEETSHIIKGRPVAFGERSFDLGFVVNLKEKDAKEASESLFKGLFRKVVASKNTGTLKA